MQSVLCNLSCAQLSTSAREHRAVAKTLWPIETPVVFPQNVAITENRNIQDTKFLLKKFIRRN